MFTDAAVRFTSAAAEHACIDYPLASVLCADEIGQRIIRAYVRLVFQPVDTDGSRSIVVMRLGTLEVRLTELHPADAKIGLPPLRIEVFDWLYQTSIDSIGTYGLDEDELDAAVEMVVGAAHDAGTRNGSPPH
jgi:hypothetical protein